MSSSTETALDGLQLNESRFLSLLEKLIGESQFVQNTGVGTAFVPEEDRVVKHVLECLEPFTVENGGKLIVERKSYTFLEEATSSSDCLAKEAKKNS